MTIMTFEQAIEKANQEGHKKKHLLLGNGFSIACKSDIFQYSALFEQADFSDCPELKKAFKALKTSDFEEVINNLNATSKLLPAYSRDEALVSKISQHAEILKEILVSTVAGNHPAKPFDIDSIKYWNCKNFLNYFLADSVGGKVYTFNYDLLLYWTLMQDDNPFLELPEKLKHNDGFGNPDYDDEENISSYVVWKSEDVKNKQNVYYLHGALHFFDNKTELQKPAYSRTGKALVDQIREALSVNKFPLFVAEGTSNSKLEKIRHNAYLQHSFKSFHVQMDQANQCLFIYGHSLAENDSHIFDGIVNGRVPKIYISLYGDINSDVNKGIRRKAELLAAKRKKTNKLSIEFYDAASSKVWG